MTNIGLAVASAGGVSILLGLASYAHAAKPYNQYWAVAYRQEAGPLIRWGSAACAVGAALILGTTA